MAIPPKLDWPDAQTHGASQTTIPPLTPQLVNQVIKQLSAQSGAAATDPQIWTAAEQNQLRDTVDGIIDHLSGETGGTPGLQEWQIGHAHRSAKLTSANGIVDEYDATAAATAAQIAAVRPGTNEAIWLNRNFRFLEIGDNSASAFTFNHGFTSGRVIIEVRERASGDVVYPHVANVDGVVSVNFSQPIGLLSHVIEVKR